MIPEKKPLPRLASTGSVAQRLRATRVALGLRPVDVCRAIGIRQSAYANYEPGGSRPNLDDMIRYAEIFHVPLDWIYRGDPSGLPHRIAREILKSG